jgi:hypothetical protein
MLVDTTNDFKSGVIWRNRLHHLSTGCLVDAGMISSTLELHRYSTGRRSRVVTALTLLKEHLFK